MCCSPWGSQSWTQLSNWTTTADIRWFKSKIKVNKTGKRTMLSHFSHVWLCATHRRQPTKAPPSLGFSRQEHWSGLPFPSPMHQSESEVAESCPTLSDPMDCSLPGSSLHGISQSRVLEWGAIAFSKKEPYFSEIKKLRRSYYLKD